MTRALIYFALGAFISLVFIVELRGCGPTLADQISKGLCERTGGAWDSTSNTCVRKY
jgi:hypothetical protein